MVENQYLNGEYKKAKKILKNFKKEDKFYYWYRVKKEAKIIEYQVCVINTSNKKESFFISDPNYKGLLEINEMANNPNSNSKINQSFPLFLLLLVSQPSLILMALPGANIFSALPKCSLLT